MLRGFPWLKAVWSVLMVRGLTSVADRRPAVLSMDIFNANTRHRVASHAVKLHLIPTKKDYDELLGAIGDARVVLIGS